MIRILSRLGSSVLLAGFAAGPASAQTTHVVRLIADTDNDTYRFEPAKLVVQPNDLIVFRVASGAPHSIVFEGANLSPGVRGAINSALQGRSGDLSSPLLTATDRGYRMVVPQVPAGKYPYYCLPHRAYDMRGEIVIR